MYLEGFRKVFKPRRRGTFMTEESVGSEERIIYKTTREIKLYNTNRYLLPKLELCRELIKANMNRNEPVDIYVYDGKIVIMRRDSGGE